MVKLSARVKPPEVSKSVPVLPILVIMLAFKFIPASQPEAILMAVSVPVLPVIVPILIPFNVPAPTPEAAMFIPFWVPAVVMEPVVKSIPEEVIDPSGFWVILGIVIFAPLQAIEPAVPLVNAPAVERLKAV